MAIASSPPPKTASASIPIPRGGDATVTRGVAISPEFEAYGYTSHAYLTTPPVPISQSLQAVADHPSLHTTLSVPETSKPRLAAPALEEASGAITPAMLAKYHLPGVLLQHGPLAIRHVTAYLVSSLPGFSAIPPAKQRRLVVGALEGKGGPAGGGVDGDVVFEKIGWGRWDAHKRGDPPRTRGSTPLVSGSSFAGKSAGATAAAAEMQHSTSYSGENGIFPQSEEDDVEMAEGYDTSSSESDDDDDEMTDEEDWAQMGAELLRRKGGASVSPITSDGWSRSPANYAWTWEMARAKEEREAVEALVKLSSV